MTGTPWDPKLEVVGPKTRRKHHDAPLVFPVPGPRGIPLAASSPGGVGAEAPLEVAPLSPLAIPEE